MSSSIRLSVVCNVRAPYAGDWNFPQSFYAIWYQVKFYGDRTRGTPPLGALNTRGVAEYSDFRPIESYISKTVQDMS